MTKKSNHEVIQSLSKLLADSYVLYLKTQNYHWNVTGPQFGPLHAMFEGQYTDLAGAIDEVAERIRALGEKAPGSFSAFAKLATVKEENSHPSADQMVKNLANDNQALVETAEAVIKAASEVGDEASMDLAIGRVQTHQKNHWMLKAYLE